MMHLPLESVLPQLLDVLSKTNGVVLQAPPGAGKTTGVPLALLNTSWRKGGRIIMLEPRRLAARAAARRMADTLGQMVGETVGFRVRGESRVSPQTCIEVVTEGILTGMLQQDPELTGISTLIFDEFHERSLHADLGLALALDCRDGLREDLRLIVMSATLDGSPVANLLGGAPLISSQGRAFPVETRYRPPRPGKNIVDSLVRTVCEALATEKGSLLAFLPGEREIRMAEAQLKDANLGPAVALTPLYGALPTTDQERALRPAMCGSRKVVLATDIAETSLTIEGIRLVVDSGQRRAPRFDPRSGMTRLETRRISQASAGQRRGRAGRTEAGICFRLWSEAEHKGLEPFSRAEILEGDLAPLVLELAKWGVTDANTLRWLDPPPPGPFAQAQSLLVDLGALDQGGHITEHGKAMALLGAHPRLSHMMLKARNMGFGRTGCNLAALLEERDVIRFSRGEGSADMAVRLDLMAADIPPNSAVPKGATLNKGALLRARQSAQRWHHRLSLSRGAETQADLGGLIALAYPDRIAQRRVGAGTRYQLASGQGAVLPDHEPLAAETWLAVADLAASGSNSRIQLAAPLSLTTIESLYGHRFKTLEEIVWDDRQSAVIASVKTQLNRLTLISRRLENPDPEGVRAAMLAGIGKLGLAALPWTDELRNWQARVTLLRLTDGDDWPDVSDQALADRLDEWIGPFLGGSNKKSDLVGVNLGGALKAALNWEQQRRLDILAPPQITVPSGSKITLDYTHGNQPVLAVRLQEMFGQAETPTVAAGRVPVLLHLLSPARRPLQVTQDLKGFWASSYHAVKAEMKGRYPKHPWPDDPLSALPTSHAKPRKK